MSVVVWLLEFVVCWIVCILVVTNIDPLVDRFSLWFDSKVLKRDAPGVLAVTTVETRIDDKPSRRR
jgi:hypothetical protein